MKRDFVMTGCVVAGTFSLWATPAFAYLGPGAGLSAIGAFLALVMGVIVAFFGFLWYPLKRLLRRGKAVENASSTLQQPSQAKSIDEGA